MKTIFSILAIILMVVALTLQIAIDDDKLVIILLYLTIIMKSISGLCEDDE